MFIKQQQDFYKTKINGKEVKIALPDLSRDENPLIQKMPADLSDPEYLSNPFARVAYIDFDIYDFAQPKSQPEQPTNTKQQEIEQKAEEQIVVQESIVVASEHKYPIQTEDFCNINDIFNLCIVDQTIKEFNLSDAGLMQEIRKHIRTFDRHIRLNPQTNANISCISRSNVPELMKKLTKSLQKSARKGVTVKTEKQNQKASKSESVTTKKQIAPRQDISLTPIVIKKYIPKKLWKDICKACGKNFLKQKMVLENINAVNTNLNETLASTHIQIIKPDTHERTNSSYLKRENVNCIVQSVTDSLRKDNKRIIWSYLPHEQILVCTDVYIEHTKTRNGNSYSKSRDFASVNMDANGKQITIQRIVDEQYLDVEELLQKPDINEYFISETTTETRSGILEGKSDKKTYIAPNIKIKTPQNIIDVRGAETYLQNMIDIIQNNIKNGLEYVSSETDAAKQLKQMDAVHDAIVQKAKFEMMIQEIRKTNDILKEIQSNIKSFTR